MLFMSTEMDFYIMCLSGMVIETLEVLGHDDNRELMPKVVETQWHQLYESM